MRAYSQLKLIIQTIETEQLSIKLDGWNAGMISERIQFDRCPPAHFRASQHINNAINIDVASIGPVGFLEMTNCKIDFEAHMEIISNCIIVNDSSNSRIQNSKIILLFFLEIFKPRILKKTVL